MNTEFLLDFGGFYDSIHSDYIDSMIESYSMDYDDVNYKETHKQYAQEYIKVLNYELDVNLLYISLYSPKYYNFETDTIEVSIKTKELEELKSEYLKDQDFIDDVNESSKSRDGFTSFCSGIDAISEDNEMFARYLFKYMMRDVEIYINEVELIEKEK